jgi:glutaredoxin
MILAAVVSFCLLVAYAEARDARPGADARARQTKHEVVMYVMPGCGYCEAARQHLRARGVAWTERDIEADAGASDEFDAYGARGTPLILVDGKRVLGFDPERIDALLTR